LLSNPVRGLDEASPGPSRQRASPTTRRTPISATLATLSPRFPTHECLAWAHARTMVANVFGLGNTESHEKIRPFAANASSRAMERLAHSDVVRSIRSAGSNTQCLPGLTTAARSVHSLPAVIERIRRVASSGFNRQRPPRPPLHKGPRSRGHPSGCSAYRAFPPGNRHSLPLTAATRSGSMRPTSVPSMQICSPRAKWRNPRS